MSRRYVKELAIESGTPLGIVHGSNYAKALNRDSVVKVISRDMNMVGDDLRRSENRVYAEYIVKNGKIAAPAGGKWAIVTGKTQMQEENQKLKECPSTNMQKSIGQPSDNEETEFEEVEEGLSNEIIQHPDAFTRVLDRPEIQEIVVAHHAFQGPLPPLSASRVSGYFT